MKVAIIFGGPYRGNPTNMENHLKNIGNSIRTNIKWILKTKLQKKLYII